MPVALSLVIACKAGYKQRMEDDIRKLQETVSHQQDEITRLSDELYLQQRLINELRAMLGAVKSQVEEIGDSLSDNGADRPPPHY